MFVHKNRHAPKPSEVNCHAPLSPAKQLRTKIFIQWCWNRLVHWQKDNNSGHTDKPHNGWLYLHAAATKKKDVMIYILPTHRIDVHSNSEGISQRGKMVDNKPVW